MRLVTGWAKVHRALALTPTPTMLQSIVLVTLLGCELELLRNISLNGPLPGKLITLVVSGNLFLVIVCVICVRTLLSSDGCSPIMLGPQVLRIPLNAKVVTHWLCLFKFSWWVILRLLLGAEHSPLPTLVERLLLLLLIVLTLTLSMARVPRDPLSSLLVTLRPLPSGMAELLYTRDRNAGLRFCVIRLVLRVSRGCIYLLRHRPV